MMRGGRRRARMRVRMMVRRMQRRRRRRRRRRILLVGGLVAFGAYKMSTKDAQKIEEHTGTNPEEMTDEELEKAMAELNIEKQYRDDSDQAVDGNDQEYYDEPAGGSNEPDYMEELERLAGLKDQGIITEEEFEAKKKQLLGL